MLKELVGRKQDKEKTYKNKPKTIKKMVIGPFISIITLNVNGLNDCVKENIWMYALPLTTSLCLTPQTVCNYFTLLG